MKSSKKMKRAANEFRQKSDTPHNFLLFLKDKLCSAVLVIANKSE